MQASQMQNEARISAEDNAERLLFSLSSLGEIGELFISETDFEKIAETALRGIMGAVAASCGALLVFNGESRSLTCTVAHGLRTPQLQIEVDSTLHTLLVKAQSPLILDRKQRALPEPLKPCAEALRLLKAHLCIPLVVRGDLLGLLVLGEKFLQETYGDEDLHLLGAIGHHFSIGLYNQRLIAESRETNFQLNRKVVEQETLYDAGLTLSSTLEVEEVIEEILLLAVGVVDARGGFLFVKDERSGRPVLEHQIGLSEKQCEALNEPSLRRRLGRAMKFRKLLRLGPEDVPDDLEVEHTVIAPVGELGLLGVVDKESRQGIQPFSEADVHLLELLGQQAGAALANARLYKNILEVKNTNQNILSSIGDGVISTDLEGRIVQVNLSVIERIFRGIRVPIGRSCARFFRQRGCTRIAEAVNLSLQDGESRRVDGEQVTETGVTLNARIATLRNERKEVQGVVIALEDLTQEMRIETMFKQYASDQVVELLLDQEEPPVLGGEEREVTILFVDMRGSTALLERIGAEEMVASLNDCFSRLNEIIFENNGTFDKYTGDGFMVVYGAPLSFPDDSERAVRTALAMRDEMVRFNKKREEPLNLAFGISRGRVLAGNIGSLRRMEYTVYGPSVNLASRLCDGARGGQIWVGPNIYGELKGRFEFEYLGRQSFKGTESDVYEILGPKGTRRRSSLKKDGETMAKKRTVEKKVDLTIPMLPEMELAATKTAEAVANFMKLEQDKVEEIKMALIEACINAFEHSQSKDRRVFINFDIGEQDLTIQITDTGQGFDPEAMRAEVVKRRERGESRRGWGLKIMEELMDEVKFQSDQNGTAITMVKHR